MIIMGRPPRPAQRDALQPTARCVVLEAETGSGRTEAALWRFRHLFAAGDLDVTAAWATWFAAVFGIDVAALRPGARGLRAVAWTGERRHHLAGPLGSRVLRRCCDLGWLTRTPGSRAVQFLRLAVTAYAAIRDQRSEGVKASKRQPVSSCQTSV